MKKIVKRYQEFIKKERRLYIENQEAIRKSNRSVLQWVLVIALAISLVTTIFCFVEEEYQPLQMTYSVVSIGLLCILLVQRRLSDSWSLPLFYSIFLVAIGYAFYSAAILYPEYTGALALGIVIVMPTLILDKGSRIIMMELFMIFADIWLVIPRKLPDLRQDELIYIITFSLGGLMMGSYLRRVRLENLELLRQSMIRETTDALTGLHNRRKLFDYLIQCEAGEEKSPVTGVSIMDIDFFKTYNDTYGHLAGDNCLKIIGECLADYGKKHNMEFYRYGGEEFVGIAHEQDTERLIRSFENVITSVAILQIPHQAKEDGIVTMSQGVYLLSPGGLEEPAELVSENEEGEHLNGFRAQQYLSKADEALYQAKEQGRNRTILYSEINDK